MKWNRWPYWVRGGIITVLAALMYAVYYYQTSGTLLAQDTNSDFFSSIFLSPLTVGHYIALKTAIYSGSLELAVYSGFAITLITAVITYFLLGSLCGWLYGKIKNHKKLEANSYKP